MKREAVVAGLASQGMALISRALEEVALWFSGKCVFDKKVHFCDNQNTPRKGPIFGQIVRDLGYRDL